jgi:hypothetical protein
MRSPERTSLCDPATSETQAEGICSGKKEAPAAGEAATSEGGGTVAPAEAKTADIRAVPAEAAKIREGVAAKIDVDRRLSVSTEKAF